MVVFEVPSLEATPTSFEVMLDTCGEIEGTPIVGSVTYVDDEDNTPDLASIEGAGIVPICDGESFVPSTCIGFGGIYFTLNITGLFESGRSV